MPSVRRTLLAAAAALSLVTGTLFAALDKAPATRPAVKKTTEAEAFFAAGPFPKFVIDVDPKQLKGLNDQPRTHVPAKVREVVPGRPDAVYEKVGIHLKGAAGSFRKVEDKPALNLNFDKFNKGQTFHGLDKVLLNNSVQDPAYMSENLCGWIFREAGGFAARASNARVTLNGKDQGLYVIKEGFDTVFFKKHFKDSTGNLYEGSFGDIDRDMPLHFGVHHAPPTDPKDKVAKKAYDEKLAADTKAANARLHELVLACQEPDTSKQKDRLRAVLDVDAFLTFMACESIIGHWDGYCAARNNFRVYHNPADNRLYFIAHGMDQVFQRTDYPLVSVNQALVCRALLRSPEDKQRYYDRVAELRRGPLSTDRVLAELDRISARLIPFMQSVSQDALRQHKEQTASLRQRIAERLANVDKQVANPPQPLKFDTAGRLALAAQPWEEKPGDAGPPVVIDKIEKDGVPCLRLKIAKPAGTAVGSWRLPVNIEPGRYVFEARVKTSGVIPAARPEQPAMAGAGIRISGAKKATRLTGDAAWQDVRYEFEVTDFASDTVLVCDLNAKAGEVLYDLRSLHLRKK